MQTTKIASCRSVHDALGREFSWQRGYGAFAVQPRGLDGVAAYVRNQREHHARGTTIRALERTSNDDAPDAIHPDAR